MKLFLAIDLPIEAKKTLNTQLQDMQKEYRVFNWVHEENFRIMIHSFGEVLQPKSIIENIKEVLFDQQNFYLYVSRLDYLMTQQITIYTDFRKEQKYQYLINALGTIFPLHSKELEPHIVVANCRIPSKQQYFVIKKKIERTEIDLSFQVKELVLFENVLSEKKSMPRKVISFPLL